MPTYSIHRIAGLVHGRVSGSEINYDVEHLLIDSRKLVFPETSAFFAIRTERRDGHHFIPELYSRGVRAFIVSHDLIETDFPDAVFVTVKDTLRALQELVASHRKSFHIPVIGITGSNGKTIVKEWMNHLLEPDLRIIRSPKSYNSQVGVPLSVWPMSQADQLGIFEAGISQPGEMEELEKIIRPTIGIFTNIGEAHDEGFRSKEEKLLQKLMLFRHAETLIYCRDHHLIYSMLKTADLPITYFSWGTSEGVNLQILSIDHHSRSAVITGTYLGQEVYIRIPFTDEASVENAIHCWSYMLFAGYKNDVIAGRMLTLQPVAMRLELKKGINGSSLINDSYSADWNSLQIALDFLVRQQQETAKTVILSDFAQTGKDAESLYPDIAAALRQKEITRLIGIGPDISSFAKHFEYAGIRCSFFLDTISFLDQFHPSDFRDETILLKGARLFEFERISNVLEQQVHQTVLEINLNSITFNLKRFQQILQPDIRLMVMVKAFSYGTGSYEIANLLQFHHVDYLAVAYTDEGAELRKAGINLPIMVMNTDQAAYETLTKYDLQPELFSFEMMRSFDNYLRSEAIQDYPVHIKLDTGMHRLGFSPDDIEQLASFILQTRSFRVQSVFSHLVAGEDPAEDEFTLHQAAVFNETCDRLQAKLQYAFLKHIANTATIRRFPGLQMDMVRLGIGLYGVDPSNPFQHELKEVSTLKTTIAQIRNVSAGETVGYNRRGKLLRDSKIATIRIGYADGYPRSLGNGAGKVLIRGKLFPTIGSVCMDMTMIDITDADDISEGMDVIIFGEKLSVSRLAKWAGTIPYELLTGISPRVRRVYFEE